MKVLFISILSIGIISFTMQSCVSSKKYNSQIFEKNRLYESFKRSQIEVRDLRAKNLTITEEYLNQDEKRKSELKAVNEIRNAYKQDSLRIKRLLSDAENKVKEFMYFKMEMRAKSTSYENQISELNIHIQKQSRTINLLSKKLIKERRLKRELINFYERKIKNK